MGKDGLSYLNVPSQSENENRSLKILSRVVSRPLIAILLLRLRYLNLTPDSKT